MITVKDYNVIINHILDSKLPSNIKRYFSHKDLDKILKFMLKDKKKLSKKINLILLKKIGSTIINYEYSNLEVKEFLKKELIN